MNDHDAEADDEVHHTLEFNTRTVTEELIVAASAIEPREHSGTSGLL